MEKIKEVLLGGRVRRAMERENETLDREGEEEEKEEEEKKRERDQPLAHRVKDIDSTKEKNLAAFL